MSVHRGLFGVVLAAVLGAGCAELPSAAELEARAEGVYVLRQVAGRALPATLRENETLTVIVEADTLFLYRDGTGVHITVQRLEYRASSGFTNETVRWASPIRYSLRGAGYEASSVCPPNANCIAPPHWLGFMGEDGLEIVYYIGGDGPMEYERLPICMACKETD